MLRLHNYATERCKTASHNTHIPPVIVVAVESLLSCCAHPPVGLFVLVGHFLISQPPHGDSWKKPLPPTPPTTVRILCNTPFVCTHTLSLSRRDAVAMQFCFIAKSAACKGSSPSNRLIWTGLALCRVPLIMLP